MQATDEGKSLVYTGETVSNALSTATAPDVGTTVTATLTLDADTADFVSRQESIDGEALEPAVQLAYNDFIVGCKADESFNVGVSNWSALKLACILGGARTISAALEPLASGITKPTPFNFVAADYDRKTGLVGNAVDKYINTNRLDDSDPSTNKSFGVYVTELPTAGFLMGTAAGSNQSQIGGNGRIKVSSSDFVDAPVAETTGVFIAMRANTTDIMGRVAGTDYSGAASLTSTVSKNQLVFARTKAVDSDPELFNDARMLFLFMGELVDRAALDARLIQLEADLAAAIA